MGRTWKCLYEVISIERITLYTTRWSQKNTQDIIHQICVYILFHYFILFLWGQRSLGIAYSYHNVPLDREIETLVFGAILLYISVTPLYIACGKGWPGNTPNQHDDVIKWKHFPYYWPFVWGIHRSLVNSSHKGQWRGDSRFSLICAWINGWVNNREAGDLVRHRAHYDVTVMKVTLTPPL